LKSITVVDTTAVDAARRATESVRETLKAWETFNRANDLHRQLMKLDILCDMTRADGLPGQKLRSKIDTFNELLKTLCTNADWDIVKVERDGSVTCNNRKWKRLSGSEGFRTKAAIQTAFAQYDKSDLICLDGADILDGASIKGGLSGLVYLSDQVETPMLITCKADSVAELKAVVDNEFGRVYLVDAGILYEIDWSDAPAEPAREVEPA
jgi:hypothetical protein